MEAWSARLLPMPQRHVRLVMATAQPAHLSTVWARGRHAVLTVLTRRTLSRLLLRMEALSVRLLLVTQRHVRLVMATAHRLPRHHQPLLTRSSNFLLLSSAVL
jgi:hypothetical protein